MLIEEIEISSYLLTDEEESELTTTREDEEDHNIYCECASCMTKLF